LIGTWRGTLSTYQADLPLELRILESGAVHVRLEKQLETLLTNVRWRDGWLRGQMRSDIHTPDAERRPYQLDLTLKLRGRVLNGPASAIRLSGRRAGNALTSWVEVRQ
jgi:hypothetical protein